jgi:hypothetical protein
MSDNVITKIKKIKDIDTVVEVPWNVWRLFGTQQQRINIVDSNEISLGEDYATLEEARTAIKFYVEQFGGKVKWVQNVD